MGLRKTTACFLRDAGGELIHNTSTHCGRSTALLVIHVGLLHHGNTTSRQSVRGVDVTTYLTIYPDHAATSAI